MYESPVSSPVVFMHPMKKFMGLDDMHTFTKIYLGAYGAPTLKPLKLFTNQQWVEQLVTARPRVEQTLVTVNYKVLEGGKRKRIFSGKEEELRVSEHYTRAFAVAVVKAWLQDQQLGLAVPAVGADDGDVIADTGA